MNIFRKAVATLAITAATASAADAALVTNTYQIVSSLEDGPTRSVTQKFTLTFDPRSDATAKITDYSGSVPGALSNAGTLARIYSAGYTSWNHITLFYADNGEYFGLDAPGYLLTLSFDERGNPFESFLSYSSGPFAQDATASTPSIVTASITPQSPPGSGGPGSGGPGSGGPTPGAVAAAVPEPATWAMMILGFGVVGGAMRRRRTTLRYA